MESLRRGIALINEETMTLRPWMLEMVLSGLITLKDLKALRFTPDPYKNMPM
jgi:hypothetical protein